MFFYGIYIQFLSYLQIQKIINSLLNLKIMKTQFLLIILLSFSSVFYFGDYPEVKNTSKTITGIVTDTEGEPIAYASIFVKENSKINTLTNKFGEYSIEVSDDYKTLVFTGIGYEAKDVEITDTKIDVTLKRFKEDIDIHYEEDTGKPIELIMDGDVDESEVILFDDISVAYDKTESVVYEKAPMFSSVRSALSGKVAGVTTKKHSFLGKTTTTEAYVYEEETIKETKGEKRKDKEFKKKKDKKESGQLTAGEINDFSKWNLWQDITGNQLEIYKDMWGFYPLQRYSLLITDQEKKPIINCKIQLLDKNNKIVWSSRTDNTGKAELWANMFDSTYTDTDEFVISMNYYGEIHSIDNPTLFQDGLNKYVIKSNCNIPDAVDIAFVIDATGSMGDELLYLQAEIEDVVKATQKKFKKLDINLGSVFYRDHNEEYLTVKSDFDSKIKNAVKFIDEQEAQAGGDFPEAVEDGLEVAVNELKWRDKARTRIIFLVLDAPPHNEQETVERLQKISQIASEKGIRIVPITCSGIDKSTEYLMRSLALATNGTYVFLTDDSGIGDSHIKPTTDKFEVEMLNELLIRLLDQYITTPDCKNNIVYDDDQLTDTTFVITPTDNPQDTSLVSNPDSTGTKTDVDIYDYSEGIKYYPNPTQGPVNIEIKGDIKELYVVDYSGKILERREIYNKEKVMLDITQYPAGMYFIKFLNKDKWMTGKIILVH